MSREMNKSGTNMLVLTTFIATHMASFSINGPY